MRKALLTITLGFTALVLLAAVVLGVFLATFNPNDYKEQFSAAVEKATGRQLVFGDDIEMTFFPTLGLRTGRLLVTEPADFGGEPFLAVESASVALAVEPLLQDRVEVRDLTLQGARLKLATTADGRNNWEYGFGGKAPAPGASGAAPAKGGGDSRDLPAQGVEPLEPLQAAAEGSAADDAARRFAFQADQVACSDLSVVYRDMRTNASYVAGLDGLALSGVRLDADIPVELAGRVKDEHSGQGAAFTLAGTVRVSGGGDVVAAIRSFVLSAEGIAAVTITLDGRTNLHYEHAARRVRLEGLEGFWALPAAGDAGKPLRTAYTGRATLERGARGAAALSGEMRLDRLDLDALLARLRPSAAAPGEGSVTGAPNLGRPVVAGGRSAAAAPPARQADRRAEPLFAGCNADLALSAGLLTVGALPLKEASATLRMQNGQIKAPYRFELYGGAVSGTATADVRKRPLAAALDMTVKGLNLAAATDALPGKYTVTGRMDAALAVSGQGENAAALMHSLKGKASAQALGGEVRGFALIPADLPNFKPVPDTFPFERISASAVISQGTATSKDITLLSKVLTGRGGGTVLLAYGQMDLGIDFMLAGLPPAVPVTISGPFAALSYGVDMRTFLRNVAESALVNDPKKTARDLLKGVGGLLLRQ